jgi:putative acetyltransferase
MAPFSERQMEIRVDDPRSPRAAQLLRQHLEDMQRHSPPESIHALDIEGLCRPSVTFWTAWSAGELLGCAALAELDKRHGEIKSMRTASAHLRKGVAAALLQHIIDEARQRAYVRLSLETGSMAAFAPARMLYARFGFEFCAPFGNYVLDPYSVFMHRLLTPADT